MKLYRHQTLFLQENPNKALLAFEMRTGKTLTAVEWLRSRQGNAIVVVPKRITKHWKTELGDVHATVITKEQWKKTDFKDPTALVLDEAHYHSSPLFTRQRSQLSTKTYEFIKSYPDMPVLLLSGTPISSSPANLHTLLCFIGVYIPWKEWRKEFYELQRLPFLPRPAWMPKKDWRVQIRKYLLKYAHIALMRDVVELPPVTEETITVKGKPYIKDPMLEVSKAFVTEHRWEQKEKGKTIRELGQGYRKCMVVCHFREQIDSLYAELSKDKQTYVLHGGITDQESVIRQAQEDDDCYFICQFSCGVGFSCDTFSVMIFASMGYSYVSFVQMKARTVSAQKVRPLMYYYLIEGRCDKGVMKQLSLGKDFDPKYFYEK